MGVFLAMLGVALVSLGIGHYWGFRSGWKEAETVYGYAQLNVTRCDHPDDHDKA